MPQLQFCEFFAGGGMARAGLGPLWHCVLANDHDPKKVRSYEVNWGSTGVAEGDVREVSLDRLIDAPDLVWASFPCQDLSQAGAGAGLRGDRSGVFWPFWSKMVHLKAVGLAPRAIVIENVRGMLTSHGGKDFAAVCRAYRNLGYRMGALIVDAKSFLPQSRPRLFIVGLRDDIPAPTGIVSTRPIEHWHPARLVAAQRSLARDTQAKWLWWNPSVPVPMVQKVKDIVEDDHMVPWHSKEQTEHLLGLMDSLNTEKVLTAKSRNTRLIGAVFRRRRPIDGGAVQRAEVRFDDIAGCLRTPTGGSSRQTLLFVDGECIRSRLLTPREGARLMGLPDSYALPSNNYDAHHLVGDGVAVPVVDFLSRELLVPTLAAQFAKQLEMSTHGPLRAHPLDA